MIISNTELIQASIELVGGFVCLILSAIILINRHRKHSMKLIVKMLFITAGLFVCDAMAYLFRGNTDICSLIMTRVSNFSVFFLNIDLAYGAIEYIYSLLAENGVSPSGVYRKILRVGVFLALIILVTNLFTGWMYSFDVNNYYHRNVGWYVYTALCFLCLVCSCVLVLQYSRHLNRFTLFSLLFFELFPIIAIVLQSFFYGISIANIGIGISVILILTSYLVNWSRANLDEWENTQQIRRSSDAFLLFIIMIVSISASIVSCLFSIRSIVEDMSIGSSQVISQIVYDRMENLFQRPITVTQTMSKDFNLRRFIQDSSNDPQEAEPQIAAYLESIRSGFDYQMVYVVCEDSRVFYTYDGFIKTIDPEQDPSDFWYRDFVASGKPYEIQVDTDEANRWNLSVFVNTAITDENGNLLGVCGIGIDMESLQQQLLKFEAQYNIRIKLTDLQGRYQIESGRIQREQVLLPSPTSDAEDIITWKSPDGILQMTKSIDDLGWFLTVENLAPDRVSLSKILIPNVAVFLAGLLVLAVCFFSITIRERKIARELLEKRKSSLYDALSGLKNRRALQEDSAALQESGRLKDCALILIDLNELKSTNDTLGHQAGDEMIVSTAQCLLETVQNYGQIYRTGGDEFVVILECPPEKAEGILRQFDQLTSSWNGKLIGSISTARGMVFCRDYPQLGFAELLNLADQRMYSDKRQYYIEHGKNPR